MGACAVGAVSGEALESAVAVGAIVMGLFSWGNIWIYLLANFAGGAAAAFVFLFSARETVEATSSRPSGGAEASDRAQSIRGTQWI